MTPYYEGDGVTLYHGDCLKVTEWLAADVMVTDPPYGRGWKQGDTGTARGWVSDRHDGIQGDSSTSTRDAALALWDRPGVMFGDLMLPPPSGTRHVLIYDKGSDAGFIGGVGGYRRNAEAIYLVGSHGGQLGGRSAILQTSVSAGGNYARRYGHPHAKPLDVMEQLIDACPPGVIADPFAGSGSTLVAARNLGRKAVGVEIEERYCEIIARRLDQAVLPL